MAKIEETGEVQRENDLLYNEKYYQNYNGDDYGRNEKWFSFFGNIADNIVEKIQPKTVLDIGCAYGLLVESLRDRGCEAFGIDVSDYALSQAREDIVPHLTVDTVLRPMERKFDLIVTIEVIEHIKEDDCKTAIGNMCAAADNILLATTPDDFDDPTHFNVQPPTYWIKKFAEFGFVPDIMHDAGYLTPYAILFVRSSTPIDPIVGRLFGDKKLKDYHFSQIQHQRNILESEKPVYEAKIERLRLERDKQEQVIVDSAIHAENLTKIVETERKAREHLQRLFDQRSSSFSWKITKPIRIIGKIISVLRPFKPELLGENNAEEALYPKLSDDVSWAKIHILAEEIECCEVNLIVRREDNYVRLPLLKLSLSEEQAILLARLEPGCSEVSINTLRGEPKNLSMYGISSANAWFNIMMDRWKKGSGVRGALGLVLRTSKVAIQDGVGAALSNFWPSYKTQIGTYDEWLIAHDGPTQHAKINSFLEAQAWKPRISVVMPTYNSNIDFLIGAVASVRQQSYSNWELCIADDGSQDEKVLSFLKNLSKEDKIDVVFRSENGHIAIATNSALELATGDFVTFLDHDDKLHPHALAAIVAYLNKNQTADIFYTDEDKLDQYNNRSEPFFKPTWSPDLLLSQNYICHLAVYRKTLLDGLNGFRVGTEGAQDYDLILRATEKTDKIIHIPHVLYHWRAAPGSTALELGEKNYAQESANTALKDAIGRRGINSDVIETGLAVYHRVKYHLPIPPPKVSIIIPTKDRIDLLSVCINGLLHNTDYENVEILIIDNESQEEKTREYFDSLEKIEKIRIVSFPGEFNFSAINNFAVGKSSGEVVVLLNNDVEIIHKDWLTELVSHAMRPGIGAVGCRLYYPDDYVQHDGIIVGIGGVAGYAHPRMERSASGAFGRSSVICNYSAVTAAVLAIKRSTFNEVSGFDEENLAVAFNDVDFCLRLGEAGYRNLYTPFAELYHHESVTRGPDTDPDKATRFEKEALYMKKRWASEIENDIYYNPNLSLKEGYSIELERGKRWPWCISQ